MNDTAKKATIWVAIAVAGKLAYDGIKAGVIAGSAYVAMKRAERKAKKAAEKEAAEAKKED